MKKLSLFFCIVAFIYAQNELTQNFDFGFTNTTGNTRTTNLNGKYSLDYKTKGLFDKELAIKYTLQAFWAKNEGVTSNEEYTSNLGLEQFIYKGWLGYADIKWLRNPDFKNYNNKWDTSFGFGKEIYKTSHTTLTIKVGIGYSYYDFADNTPNDDFTSFHQSIEYNNKINSFSLLYGKINLLEGFGDLTKNYELSTTFGLKFNLTDNFHAVLEEQINYDNQPSEGYKKTDTKTIIRFGLTL